MKVLRFTAMVAVCMALPVAAAHAQARKGQAKTTTAHSMKGAEHVDVRAFDAVYDHILKMSDRVDGRDRRAIPGQVRREADDDERRAALTLSRFVARRWIARSHIRRMIALPG